jgi:hypothetical protein
MTKLFWFHKKNRYKFDSIKLKYYEKSNQKNGIDCHQLVGY